MAVDIDQRIITRLVTLGAFFLAYYAYYSYPTLPSRKISSGNAVYDPSVVDVLVVKAMLKKALSLPPEIIDSIVDLAEYWPHTTSEVSFEPPMTACGGLGRKENMFLLRSPPLGLHTWRRVSHRTNDPKPVDRAPLKPQPPGEEFSADDFQALIASPIPLLAHPCRRIVFTFKSHDQGWGGLPNDRGTYFGSWTWFEAGLERWCKTNPAQTDSATQQAQQAPQPSLKLDDLCTVLPEVEQGPNSHGYAYNHTLHPREDLKIQCNLTAEKQSKVHRVVWSYVDDIDPERDVEAAERLAEQGRGKATGNAKFVRDLKLGDIVTIWAKARFGNWRNAVEWVKMEVFYAV
ncbi:hypothetical protein N657DRAFT_581874 [Parathielavia appendiculata]|uniref:Uncharacterized protein n=1 Tax=Parathielavia appendiculata TaxID=2587402 RepID=A0AAN6YZH8_9PEZI|nr:hypothetical protein N657DRAFT_581874 [Parathielavia appendiculata]